MNSLHNHLTITIGFRCNNNCVSCMLKGFKDQLQPADIETYKKILHDTIQKGRHTSIILSGAEVTLNPDLLHYIRYTRELGYFRHIRIQTNGRKCSDPLYARQLVDAGLDEAYVSIYGPNRDIHQSLTMSENSFDQTLAGLENLDKTGIRIITNTVVTSRNVSALAGIVDLTAPFANIREMEFWSYWPMAEEDKRHLLVSYPGVLPHLSAAITKSIALKKRVIIRKIPGCLLGEHLDLLDNYLPETIIDPLYWHKFAANRFGGCPHASQCEVTNCPGLPAAYIKRFGSEDHLIGPVKARK
ncbi:MAG: radical SAM protein [bacterium]|nr:radical SAM protein [bacterium]